MKKIILTLVCIPFLFSTQCDEDDDYNCTVETLETSSLETLYDCTETKYQMDIDLSDDYIVIQDQETFNNLVTGSCMPEIDFTTYNLLIGKQGLASGNTLITYSLSRNICVSEQWELIVQFDQNETTEAPNLTYHALIPNTLNSEDIFVRIIIN